MLDTAPFADFQTASQAVLQMLHRTLGFDLWMVTRTEGENWTVLEAEDHGYGVTRGQTFRWADSFCSQMVLGNGPSIAPRSNDVPAYAQAPVNKLVTIGAYVGVPLTQPDGKLFGTLCAIHPTEQPPHIGEHLKLIQLQAKLLSTLLSIDLQREAADRRAERAEVESMQDELTGLYNRRAWKRLLASEESRCARHGHPAVVLMIDIDGLKITNDTLGHDAGDALIKRVATSITSTIRPSDIVARLGGDEFAILGVECDRTGAENMVSTLHSAIANQNAHVSIGLCDRTSAGGLIEATKRADVAMYAEKRNFRRTNTRSGAA